jgi:hypothetical protein
MWAPLVDRWRHRSGPGFAGVLTVVGGTTAWLPDQAATVSVGGLT